MTEQDAPDRRAVWVVHGRNLQARDGMFSFLRALGLRPLEFSHAVKMTGTASPYIGEILDAAFSAAQAVVVLLTPDEIAYLRRDYCDSEDDPEYTPAAQARPNVLFEAGMAIGRHPTRTVLVELGEVRPFSDVAGRHSIRLRGVEGRQEIATRLETAGCEIDRDATDWLRAGDLTPPTPAGGGLALARRGVSKPSNAVRIDATHTSTGRGNGRLHITNHSPFDVYEVDFALPDDPDGNGDGFWVHKEGPVRRLPSGKSKTYVTARSMGAPDDIEIKVTGKLADGTSFEEECFVNLL